MIGALVIVFREIIEAGLIVGIVLGMTRGVPGRGAYVAGGVAAGVLGASILALFAGAVSEAFSGRGQEILNAGVLCVAVLMLTWHNAWMARHGVELAAESKALGRSVKDGSRPLMALAIVCGVAVLREGSELVLFLYSIVASGTSVAELSVGFVLGVGAGVVLSAVSYLGLVAIPSRYIFKVTGVLIILLAAGMAGRAVVYVYNAGLIAGLGPDLWDTSGFVSDDSILGRVLSTLMGYTDRPTALQAVAYLGTVLFMVTVAKAGGPARRPQLAQKA